MTISVLSERLPWTLKIDEITEYFAAKDMNNFWKSWSAKYSKHINAENININGYQKANDIANTFREHYAEIFINSADKQTVKVK